MTEMSSEARSWGMLAHIATFAGYLIPFGNIFGPLIVMMMRKEPFVQDQAKEALNFQISVTIYVIICIALIFVIVGLFLLPVLVLFELICTVLAAIKANQGEAYRYPMCIRFIR